MLTKNSNLSDLETAILKTIIFFDLFSHPLTAYELWRYLDLKADFEQIQKAALFLKSEQLLSEHDGFYFLPGQEKLIRLRQERYHYANRKLKIARQVVSLFKLLPTVRFVALSNLIGRHNLRDGSDIDLFIIAKKNRIWITRLFCAGLMKILDKRPTPENKKDKICLSFYVDDDHLDLSSLTAGSDDYYFHFWLAGLYPLYDAGSYHHRLMLANGWLKTHLPNGDFILNNQSYRESPRSWREKIFIFSFYKHFFNLIEYWSQSLQLKIMPAGLKNKINADSRVIVREGVLKLYLIDRRQEFTRRYQERLKQYFHA
jgi:hypothetical protein